MTRSGPAPGLPGNYPGASLTRSLHHTLSCGVACSMCYGSAGGQLVAHLPAEDSFPLSCDLIRQQMRGSLRQLMCGICQGPKQAAGA